MKVTPLNGDMVLELWPRLKDKFKSFSERSFCTLPSDYVRDIITNQRQCWVAFDEEVRAVALTTVQQGNEKIIFLTHCAGDGRGDWQDLLVDEIEKWGREIGAGRIRAECRPGWTPFLKGREYRETHRIMERDL